MIQDWRKQLAAPTLPFMVVELSGFCNEFDTHTFLTHCDAHTSALKARNWHLPSIRLAQSAATKHLTGVHVVPNHDLGALHPVSGSIHSSRKPELGARIALALAASVYGQNAVGSGPEVVSVVANPGCTALPTGRGQQVHTPPEHCVVVTFSALDGSGGPVLDPAASCPVLPNTTTPIILPLYCNGAGFEIATTEPPTAWHAAERVVVATQSATRMTVVVIAPSQNQLGTAGARDSKPRRPSRIRYAYSDWPVTSVRNGASGHGLPARLFDVPVQ